MSKKGRVERTVFVLEKIYGRPTPTFPGSPHEGDDLDEAETIIHELAHQTLMPKDFMFTPGAMAPSHDIIIEHIDTLPNYKRDLHEIRAIAIELLVSSRLRLGLDRRRILKSSLRNTELYIGCHWGEYQRIVRLAQKTPRVRFCADTIMCLIDETRTSLHRKRVVH